MKIRKGLIVYDSKEGYTYDPLKIKYLNKFLDRTHGVKTVVVVSPLWYGQDDAVLDTLNAICRNHQIPILNFANSPKYVHHNEYFKDGKHLNAHGADEFTRDLIIQLRKYLAK